MEQFHVYQDMKTRTNGEMYLGVVGPVRTGKSTFIKKFMELMVLPNMEVEVERKRAVDELPMSSSGTTITTTEPKFIPKDAATVRISDDVSFRVRLIDCVGFMVDGATGHMEQNQERLVKTPWFDYEIPFTKAAKIGTEKVMRDHATIGIVITTDGSFGDLPREAYVEAEERTVVEMKELQKPFIVLLNCMDPEATIARNLQNELTDHYKTKVIPVNIPYMTKQDITTIMESLLLEFPIEEIVFDIPKWVEAMDMNHPIKQSLIQSARAILEQINEMKSVYQIAAGDYEFIDDIKLNSMELSNGNVVVCLTISDKYYYEMLSELLQMPVENEMMFLRTLQEIASKKREYDQVAKALDLVKAKGYGAVAPKQEEIKLEKPELMKHGNRYGVKIMAQAPSIHMIRANISTEIAPIVGSEQQAKDLISYIEQEERTQADGIWQVNIFGKTLEQLVEDGLQAKIMKINDESQVKLQETMEKIVNESNGGIVCIII